VQNFESAHAASAAQSLKPIFNRTLERMKTAHATHLGYPYNLNFNPGVPASLKQRNVIVALTCRTTMKGAHDDIAGVIAQLDAAGIGQDKRYIQFDGALNALVIPYLGETPSAIRPTFRHAIDSISTSGHKMIGTPMPCGVLIAKRHHVERIASAVAYLRSNYTTLMRSRDGHAVLAI
jgi:histidine decarboxylase